jgi:hypothetical protein
MNILQKLGLKKPAEINKLNHLYTVGPGKDNQTVVLRLNDRGTMLIMNAADTKQLIKLLTASLPKNHTEELLENAWNQAIK